MWSKRDDMSRRGLPRLRWQCRLLRHERRGKPRLYLYSSAGRSKLTRSPRKPRVFQAPKAMPTAIHRPPTIQAFQLRFFQRKKQIVNPASGGVHTARTANATPATANTVQFELGQRTRAMTIAVNTSGGIAL